ncbi:MAG: tetratricopeptide repeat protein [Cytophagales bacterium]|nr:tetratricopeptide repeat protein [Cytophagales bacterium]
MKNLISLKQTILLLAFASSTALAQSPKLANADNSNMNAATFYEVLLAELANFEGNVRESFSRYLSLARKTPTDQLFERATRIPLKALDGDTARIVALEWAKTLPTSALAQNYLFQINYAQRQYGNALPPLREFLKLTPEDKRAGVILSLTRYFSAIEDKQAAASELIRILEPYVALPESTPATKSAARLTMARSQVDAGRYNDALAQLQQLTTESPESLDAWILQGALQLQENQFAAAEKSFQTFLPLAEKTNVPTNHAGYVQAYLGLAQLAENRKDYEAAQQWLAKIEDDKERLAAQLRRASILAKQGKVTEARALVQQLPEQTKAQARAKLFGETHLLRDYGQLPAAIELLKKALAEEPQDTDLMYELSTLYEKAKDYEPMEALLRQVLALAPNNAAAYNALGYSLADRGVRLEEAKTLIEKALTIAPNDPYIVDSLAWVLYRMGRLEESLKTFQAAYKTRADAEIGTHMGEVLWHMNRKDEAIKMWKEAQIINADNPTLLETLKRLGVSL